MSDIPSWHIVGDWFDNCSCAVPCPCTFAQAPDNGFCESFLFWRVREGHYGDVKLDNLSFVRVGRWDASTGKTCYGLGIASDRRARMSDIPSWHIVGDWFDNCSCAVPCPCTFAQAPDNGFCESVLFWRVREGHYGDVKLDNLSFVRVGRWEGDLWARKAAGVAGLYIDDHADDRQMEALPAIIGGRAGGFPGWVNECFAGGRQSRGIDRAKIRYEIAPDLGHWGVEIVGKIKAWAKAISGPTSPPGKYPQLTNAPGSETGPGPQLVTWGKSTILSVDAHGFKFEYTLNSAKHIPFDWGGP